MRASLFLVGLTLVFSIEGHEEMGVHYWDAFVRRPKFKDRLLYHPDTGEKLREKYRAACNLTSTWSGVRVGARDDEYNLVMTSPTNFIVAAVTGGNWSTGMGTLMGDRVHVDFDKSSVQGLSVNGTVIGCNTIEWDNGWTWKKQQHISKVHVVFMNHLDPGFAIHTPEGDPVAFMANVVNTYTQEYFPQAAIIANTMRALDPEDRLIYTTHPWLVSLYVNCPPNIKLANGTQLYCPTEAEKQSFAESVQKGDITWHDGPFNLQAEAVGWGKFFEWGLELTNQISRELNMSLPQNKVYNLRDVPGMTRAVVPWLVKNGFTTVTVGQNTWTPPTGGWYPHKIFLWKDTATGAEILAMNHAGGYPNDPGPDPENCGGLCREDCMITEGFDEALCFAFRTDNSGPPTSMQMMSNIFQILRVEFPGAHVFASTLHAFSDNLNASPVRGSLPVVTQEVGDTWIQGTSTDPLKYGKYRAFVRTLEGCSSCNISDPRIYNMTRLLLTVPEHTGGLSGASNWSAWTNADFTPIRLHDPSWANQHNSWEERRVWIDAAAEALDDHPVRGEVERALSECELKDTPSTAGYQQLPIPTVLQCKGVVYQFTSSCALRTLVLGGQSWADEDHLLGDLIYTTYDQTDYDRTAETYHGPNQPGTCVFAKPNMTVASGNTHGDYRLTNTDGFILVNTTGDGQCSAMCRAAFPAVANGFYGAPASVWTEVTVVSSSNVQLTLRNYNKTTTRLAEAMHYGFSPTPQQGRDWVYNKLGQKVSPYDTIINGNPKQHSVYPGVDFGALQINALDASVVSTITATDPATPFFFSMLPVTPGTITGMAYQLWNNIWNVNWAVYYPYKNNPDGDENVLSRYELKL